MIIGNIPKRGELQGLNKWTVGVEILRYSPTWHYHGFAFKPYIFVVCMKVTDYGTEHLEINGKPAKIVGGWKKFESPIGFCISKI